MVRTFADRPEKISLSTLCRWANLPSSVFYYSPGKGKRGAKPSTHTRTKDGLLVSNEQVLNDIRTSLGREFCCYGYHNITDDLRGMNYVINHKKVYRLMDENNLLLGKVIRANGKREFVKFRKIAASYPMEYICLDIKYVWVEGEKRNCYLLTIIDVYSRKVIDQIFQRSIRKIDVINMFRRLNSIYGIKGVIIRNDNGSQFIANDVKQYLRSVEAKQEFTHVATPEENSYIEAFHSIIDREVIQRYVFTDFLDAKLTFEAHREWYNHSRKHGAIGRITPQKKWDEYEKKKALVGIMFALLDKAEAGNAGEQPARNNPSNENDPEELPFVAPSGSFENHFCSHT